MSLADALKRPNARPVYLLEVTAGDVLKKWQTVIAIPGGLALASETTTGMTLSWDAASGATSYKVYRGTSSGSLSLVTTTAATSYADTGLSNGTRYYYAVVATDGVTDSEQSVEVNSYTLCTAPTNLAVARNGAKSLTLTWDAVSGAASYKVYRSTSSGAGFALVESPASATHTSTALANDTTYYYYVEAVNGGGDSSAASSEASKKTWAIYDSFNRANSTTTVGDAETGQTWASGSGTMGISSNKAYGVGGGANRVINFGSTVGTITHTLDSSNANMATSTIVTRFRFTDFNNGWAVIYQSGTFYLQRIVGGAGTNVQSYVNTPAKGSTVKVTFTAGDVITVYLNGAQIMTTTDSANNAATTVGFGFSLTTDRVDDFTYTTVIE